ncbi:MAG: glycosyl transferase, partial [Moorea sp. SIO2B7]|nr:glycosyl transferase [Moorena sp. SIO2B7]
MNKITRGLILVLVITLGILLGSLCCSTWDQIPTPIRPVIWASEAQWIAPSKPTYRFYARRSFNLADTEAAGWLRLSADNDFILYVNNLVVARELSYSGQIPRNTLGLASQSTDPSQNFNDSLPYSLRVRDWVQWSYPKDWKLTYYVDLTPYLRPGKNVIALEVQKSKPNPRTIVEGAIYTPGSKSSLIKLTTGATPWGISTLAENQDQLRWFDGEFNDLNWQKALAISPSTEATYSKLSKSLFEQPLLGNWITGTQSDRGEVWLRSTWKVPKRHQRGFIRFAGEGDYSLLLNGSLVNRYHREDAQLLHLYEVSNLLRSGTNTLSVRLSQPLETGWQNNGGLVGFYLDGWIENELGEAIAPISTDGNWTTSTQLFKNWTQVSEQEQSVTFLRQSHLQEFKRQLEGNAALENYPTYLWHQGVWSIGGIIFVFVWTWILGRFWLNQTDGWWDSLGAGTILLLPGNLFLIGIGLLKHRYGEAEAALKFALPHSNMLILWGFFLIVLLTLLWYLIRLEQGKRQSLYNPPRRIEAEGRRFPFLQIQKLHQVWINAHNSDLASGKELSPPQPSSCQGEGVSGVSPLFPSFLDPPPAPLKKGGARGCFAVCFTGGNRGGTQSQHHKILGLQLPHPLGIVVNQIRNWGMLASIIIMGFGLRVYRLGFVDLDPDANVSLDCVRGILRTGAPISTSGIWYTRGPVYHYALALWLRLVGDSDFNACFFSVIFGTATLILVYFLAKQVSGKVWIALLATAVLAFDPWEIWYSRNIRFYQLTQFLYLLGFWAFWQGFIVSRKRSYQYICFVTLTLMLLTQEVTITLLPALAIGALCFYRPFRLASDWKLILAGSMMAFVYVYDGIFVIIKCLTPLAGLSSLTTSYIKLYLSGDITFFVTDFFVGFNRMKIIYSVFFFLSLIYFFLQKDKVKLFLYSTILIEIIFLTIMVFFEGSRYTYPIYPLFVLLSIYSACNLAEILGDKLRKIVPNLLPLKGIAIGSVLVLLLFNIEPIRVLNSYQDSITARYVQATEYIRDHRKPGDITISNVPAVHSNILGGAD